jgi:hypothetical protein
MKACISGLIIVCLLFLSCRRDSGRGIFCLRASNNPITQSRGLAPFSVIRVEVPAKVILKIGNDHRIELQGPENIVKNINAPILEGELKLQYERCVRSNQKSLTITVIAPFYSGIALYNEGEIISGDSLIFENGRLDVEVLGTGSISVITRSKEVKARMLGSGSLTLIGECNAIQTEHTGAGLLSLQELRSHLGIAKSTGSGNTLLWCTDSLNINIEGSGNIGYKVNPYIISSVLGTGKFYSIP